MRAMSSDYDALLAATLQHLEGLKERGVRHVHVAPETLTALAQPAPRRAAAPAPRSVGTTPVAVPQVAPASPISNRQSAIANSLPAVAVSPPAQPSTFNLQPSTPAKTAAFAELRTRALACVKCPNLVASRKNVVFGVGNIEAELMFIGEAPGADEDAQGEPFVGEAGQLLTKIIVAMGLSRETVYIANILKCQPNTTGATSSHRKPPAEEIQACIPYLHEQIDLIKPKVIIALGATAAEGLLGKTLPISKLRGQWQTYRGTPLMPTYHPEYLLHNPALNQKRKVWEDMLAAMEKLGMPISDRQRKFFLKG